MMTADTWICPTCARPCQARYCADCGERALHAHDLTMLGLAEQAVEAIAHVDGRVFRTFRSLILHPGQPTESYIRGQRKPVLNPLQVFLIANVVFFGFQSLFRTNVFASPLESQLHNQFYTRLAVRLVGARLQALHTTQPLYAPVFDHAAQLNAKSLIILMTPPMALLGGLLFHRRGRPFVMHVVFAIHFYAYWMIAFCVMTPLISIALVAFMRLAGIRLAPSTMDLLSSFIWLGVGLAYLFVAAGRVYAERGVGRALKVAALGFTAALTVLGYRFVVFLITLYTTTT